jgi:hypothetical protein
MRMVKEGLKGGNLEVKTNWVSEDDCWNSFEGWCTNPLLFHWVLTYDPKCLHRRWYSGDKTMERRWLDWLGVCGVRNSHSTLRIEIVGAFPTLVCGGGRGLWASLLGTGISYNKGCKLETVTLSEMFIAFAWNKMLCIPTFFSSPFAYLLKEEAYCQILQHFFQVILPTYLKKKHIVGYSNIFFKSFCLLTYLKKKHIVEYMQITWMYILLNRWATRHLWSTHKPGPPLSENGVLNTKRNPTESAAQFDSRTSASESTLYTQSVVLNIRTF